MRVTLPPANASMLFGAGVTLCIVLAAGVLAALFGTPPVPGDRDRLAGAVSGDLDVAGGPAPVAAAARARFVAARFDELDGWDDHAAAEILVAWQRSCWRLLELPLDAPIGPPPPGPRATATATAAIGVAGTAADWAGICQAVAELPKDHAAVRAFVAEHLTPVAVLAAGNDGAGDVSPGGDAAYGLITGYYEPTLRGARRRSDEFSVPLYAPPDDLVTIDLGTFDARLRGHRVVGRVEPRDGPDLLVPFDTRADIDAGSLDGRAPVLFWVEDSLEAFMLHVQGSGRIELPDGTQTRAGFAAHNGHAYRSIGKWLIAEGELAPGQGSVDDIRAWMEANPERATDLLVRNPRFVFFRELPGEGPIGAAGVPLTPRRSLAVDATLLPLGVPIWLDADPVGAAGTPSAENAAAGDRIRRLMMTQDTGGAIQGAVRGDFYWGAGPGAGRLAGRTSSRGRYYLLLPHQVAAALVAASAAAELAN